MSRSNLSGVATQASIEKAERRRRSSGPILGAVLLVLGAGWLLGETGVIELNWSTLGALAMIVLGLGIAISSKSRRHTGLLILGGLLALVLAAASVVGPFLPLRGEFGDISVSPSTVAELENEYELAAGEFSLDLRHLQLPPGTTKVAAHAHFGVIFLTVPPDMAVEIHTSAKAGELVTFGKRQTGTRITDFFVSENFATAERRLSVELSTGAGSIEVISART